MKLPHAMQGLNPLIIISLKITFVEEIMFPLQGTTVVVNEDRSPLDNSRGSQ